MAKNREKKETLPTATAPEQQYDSSRRLKGTATTSWSPATSNDNFVYPGGKTVRRPGFPKHRQHQGHYIIYIWDYMGIPNMWAGCWTWHHAGSGQKHAKISRALLGGSQKKYNASSI